MKELEYIKGPFVPKTRIDYSPGSIVNQQITKNDARRCRLINQIFQFFRIHYSTFSVFISYYSISYHFRDSTR